ncbi:MAG: glycosyltransferase [Dorea sp.]|jgi:glycosyltransferase involved in cell wall biosynthesis|nr:glycosyltransferase [Dorea sp.]
MRIIRISAESRNGLKESVEQMKKNGVKSNKVSVVIPVYNGEKYIGQMLESVLGQSLQEIEIICVNDGSTDDSCGVIKRFMKRDSRITLLQQPNLNAGAARNRGLMKAKGKYIVFWDADDKFDRKALELMYRKIQKKQADICVCGVCEFTNEGKIYETDGYLKTAFIPGCDPFNKYDMCDMIFSFASNVVWNKMFRREFLMTHNLCFQEIRQANDTAFVMKALYQADRITCVEKYLAFYRMTHAGSLTGNSSETVFCPYESYMYTLHELKKDPDFPVVKRSFCNKAAKGMFRALNIQTSFEAYRQLYQFLQREGLSNLGLLQCCEKDMEEDWLYTDLNLIKTISAEEFLFHKANERRMDRDQLKYTLKRVRRRLAILLSLNQRFKEIRRLVKKG